MVLQVCSGVSSLLSFDGSLAAQIASGVPHA